MNFQHILFSLFAFLFVVNCSTHPEIKPYEPSESTDNSTPEEQLPYGQSISDAVFADSPIASVEDESELPTEFDDRIDMSEESDADSKPQAVTQEPVKQKKEIVKEVVVEKAKISSRSPASASGKNGFYTFNSSCPMKSEPNGDAKNMGDVSAGKKLWLDVHNESWFKAYKKSGTVYVSADCVK